MNEIDNMHFIVSKSLREVKAYKKRIESLQGLFNDLQEKLKDDPEICQYIIDKLNQYEKEWKQACSDSLE